MSALKNDALTPMYRQWAAAKRDYPDVLLLFRMGDFYEMFDDDARVGSEALGLTLTSRKYAGDKRIAMCGVPHHALDRYLRRLVEQGHRAAICEQVEDPREARGLVERKVTRVITPGTLIEDELLQGEESNFLCSLATRQDRAGLAVVDVSTGHFLVTELPITSRHDGQPPDLESAVRASEGCYDRVADEIARLQPAELLVPQSLADCAEIMEAAQRSGGCHTTGVPDDDGGFESAEQQLCGFFGVTSLRGFGCDGMWAAQEAGAQALRYLRRNRMDALPHLSGITTYSTDQFMVVDAATRRNLELVRTLREGQREGSLLGLLDRTLTPMGARLLRQWLLQPLVDVAAIRRRLDAVETLLRDETAAGELQQSLRGVRDLERLANRTTAGTANARDLSALRASIAGLPSVRAALRAAGATDSGEVPSDQSPGAPGQPQPRLLSYLSQCVDELADVAELLNATIAEQPPATITEGGLIRDGYSEDLDVLRDAMAHGREWIARLQDQERSRTGIDSLKIGFNKVFGYYLEITRANQHLVPETYQRKQTLVNAERYVTPELKETEERILGADERSRDLEYELFCAVRSQVAAHAERILATARALAQIDVLLALARVALEFDYTKPEVDDSDVVEVRDGRHPVVERSRAGEAFVPNDVHLDCTEDQLLIVTGPNMAGKSTFLRQVALVCLMAQMGSFVPARSARVGLVDRIFTRVGASDDLATGQSTFMVEMTETANILHNATRRSLIVLDEIGRGTSTFDGLSIAWAVAEYIVTRIGAKTLFATHYHHLNELVEVLPRVRNVRVAVKEQGDDIIFLRKIVPGGTDRSYGIQVARLAGLPRETIERAKDILHQLECEDLGRTAAPSKHAAAQLSQTVQLRLFEAEPDPVASAVQALDLDMLTPVEALLKLRDLQLMVASRQRE